jgi:hypothetical protein
MEPYGSRFRQWSEFGSLRTLPRNTSPKQSSTDVNSQRFISLLTSGFKFWQELLSGSILISVLSTTTTKSWVISYTTHNLTPKEYEHVIDSIKRDISHGIAVDLEDVKEDIWENMEISPNEKASKTNIRKTPKRP